MGNALSGAAGGAALGFEDLLKQKFLEQIQRAQLAEHARVADMQNATQTRGLDQGDKRIGLDERQFGENVRQFDAGAPLRQANVGHTVASTAALDRQPVEAEKGRTFSAEQAGLGRTFQGEQGNLNRGNAVRLANISGQNALRVANVRHPDGTGPAAASAAQKEANEIDDSLALINELRNDAALSSSVGPIEGRGGGYVTAGPEGYTRVKALHDNLVGKLQLAQAGKLKGQGQVSDKERDMLLKAATSLNMTLGDPDYLNQLAKVEAQFQRMRGAAAGQGGGNMQGGGAVAGLEYDYVPGKGLVPRKPK